MINLNKYDLNWVLRRLPKHVFTLMKEQGDKLFLAGGFIRSCIANERINDIDLFVSNKEDAKTFIQILAQGKKVHETDNAYTVPGRLSIQIIHRWTFDNPCDVITSFDFTIAQAIIWYKDIWNSFCVESYYADLAAKRLVYTNPIREEEAGGSMLRILKFYQRGYRIPLDSLGDVITRLVMAIDFSKTKDSPSQIAKVLTGLLREVDPDIDPTHQAHLPSLGAQND